MELYIFRHGKTVWNAARRIQGSVDIELTDEGSILTGVASSDTSDTSND